MSLGGNIGPRRPTSSGENCGNCGGVFVVEPGIIEKDGHAYLGWKCSGCNRYETWPAPREYQERNLPRPMEE